MNFSCIMLSARGWSLKTVWFHWYEMPRRDKCKGRKQISGWWGVTVGKVEECLWWAVGSQRWSKQRKSVNTLKNTELYIPRGWALWSINYILIKESLKKRKKTGRVGKGRKEWPMMVLCKVCSYKPKVIVKEPELWSVHSVRKPLIVSGILKTFNFLKKRRLSLQKRKQEQEINCRHGCLTKRKPCLAGEMEERGKKFHFIK